MTGGALRTRHTRYERTYIAAILVRGPRTGASRWRYLYLYIAPRPRETPCAREKGRGWSRKNPRKVARIATIIVVDERLSLSIDKRHGSQRERACGTSLREHPVLFRRHYPALHRDFRDSTARQTIVSPRTPNGEIEFAPSAVAFHIGNAAKLPISRSLYWESARSFADLRVGRTSDKERRRTVAPLLRAVR